MMDACDALNIGLSVIFGIISYLAFWPIGVPLEGM